MKKGRDTKYFWLATLISVLFLLGGVMGFITPSAGSEMKTAGPPIALGSRTAGGETVQWETATLFTDSLKLDGIEIGDADNDGITDLVSCGLSGVVTHIEKNGGTWKSQTIWSNPLTGEAITPDIGDVDPDKPGNEVIIGGMAAGAEADEGAGSVDMIYHDGTSWKQENLFEDTHLVHGLNIGDLDPDKDGNEIVAVGFSYNCTMIYKESGTWKTEVIYTDDGKIKKNIIGDFDPDKPGNEMAIVSKSMNVTMIYKEGGVWKSEHMFQAQAGVSRVCIGDLDPNSPGREVIAGADDGKVYVIKKSSGAWTGVEVFDDIDKNRGVWVGNVDPAHGGNELLVTGYSGNVTLVWGSGNSWVKKMIYEGPRYPGNPTKQRMHDVRIGNFDPDHEGVEAVTIGYDQRVMEIKTSPWRYRNLHTEDLKLDGVELGDADNDGKTEAVICGLAGTVTMIEYDGGVWKGSEIWDNKAAGELITPDIGDIDPDKPGNEIVVGGMAEGAEADEGAGAVDMIYLEGGVWKSEELFVDTHLIHGTTIGDLDPDIPGNEVIAVGFSYGVNMIYKEDGEWKSQTIYTDDGKIKKGIVGDFDSAHPGNELVIVSKSKNVTEVYKEDGVWKGRLLYSSEDGVSRVCIGDVDPDHPGNEILVGDDGGRGILIRGSGNNWEGKVLIDETEKNRGVWIGDIDPSHEGNEMVITGYTGTFNMFYGHGDQWTKKIIYQDSARVHDIRFGDLDPDHEGNEIVMVGYSKHLTLIKYQGADFPDPSFTMKMSDSDLKNATVDPEGTVEVKFMLDALDGFDDVVTVTASGIPDYLEYTVFPSKAEPDVEGVLTIRSSVFDKSETSKVTITATDGTSTETLTFDLSVTADTTAPTATVSIIPAGEDEYEPEEVVIMAVFSEPMDEASVLSLTTIMEGEDAYSADMMYYSDNYTLKISNLVDADGDPIPLGKEFTVSVSGDDRGGNNVVQTLTFETVEEDEPGINWISVGLLAVLAVILLVIIIVLYIRGKKEREREDSAEADEDEEEEEPEEEEEEKPKKKSSKGKKDAKGTKGSGGKKGGKKKK